MGINKRNVELVKPQSDRKLLALVDDKLQTKEILGKAGINFAKVYGVCQSFFEIDEFINSVNKESSFVLKPSRGYGGNGIEIIKRVEDDRWILSGNRQWDKFVQNDYIREILFGVYSMRDDSDVAFAEELIEAHEDISPFATDGLPDIRVIVYKGSSIAAMMRVPTNESNGKANLHAGGFAAAVDIVNGRILNGWYKNKKIDQHPESGIVLNVFKVPFWPEIIKISNSLLQHFNLQYMGVDFTVDKNNGPLILELNARPGLEIQNVLGKGMLTLIKDLK